MGYDYIHYELWIEIIIHSQTSKTAWFKFGIW